MERIMDNTIPTNAHDNNVFDGNSKRPFEKGRNPFDGLRPWSAITHGIGIALAVIGSVFLLIKVIPNQDALRITGFVVYSISMILLYLCSTLYHSVNTTAYKRIILRKTDHTAVYFLIAGTYTPLCLTLLQGPLGYSLLGVIWALAIAGTVMSFTWINCPRKLTAGIYITLGWLAVIALPFLWQTAGPRPVLWCLGGGLLYTIGGILYALKWPGRNNPRFGCHEIFHVFIVLGSIAHFFFVYRCLT